MWMRTRRRRGAPRRPARPHAAPPPAKAPAPASTLTPAPGRCQRHRSHEAAVNVEELCRHRRRNRRRRRRDVRGQPRCAPVDDVARRAPGRAGNASAQPGCSGGRERRRGFCRPARVRRPSAHAATTCRRHAAPPFASRRGTTRGALRRAPQPGKQAATARRPRSWLGLVARQRSSVAPQTSRLLMARERARRRRSSVTRASASASGDSATKLSLSS